MTDFHRFRSLLRRRARCAGERPAVVSREGVLNYREMAARASVASEELLAAGIGSGVQVANGDVLKPEEAARLYGFNASLFWWLRTTGGGVGL